MTSTVGNERHYAAHEKGQVHHIPVAGMSCAIFEIPKSKKIIIKGGSAIAGWHEDNYPDDAHYSFRIIRITVAAS